MRDLSGKTVVLGVTGGIAAYKACTLVSLLKKAGADVHTVLTRHAQEFVTPLTFEALSGNRAVTDMFDSTHEWEIGHISLAQKADIFVVAPATANLIGKVACGIADDFLSTTLMAAKCPILLAPAMNTAMFESAAYEQNAQTLLSRGFLFMDAPSGRLACGTEGKGRMAEPERIFDRVYEILCPKHDFADKTVLIASGGTREPIDPVRFIGNRSSGKTGAALAAAALNRGAKVIYIAANDAVVPSGAGVELVHVSTTAQLREAVLKNADRADCVIMAAAPADYTPKSYAKQKFKEEEFTLALQKNPDIAAEVGKRKGNKILVVFAAETENLLQNAKKKLARKRADLVVANDVTQEGAGFEVDTNIVTLLTDKGEERLPKMSKAALAERILDAVALLSK